MSSILIYSPIFGVHFIQLASEGEMERKLDHIRAILDGTSYTIRADGLQVLSSVEEDVRKIKQWIKIAKKSLVVK